MMEPTGRGDEPQVRTTVVSKAFCPASRQALSVLKTTMSRFSMMPLWIWIWILLLLLLLLLLLMN
jgi:hypothetical protein